MTQPKPHHRLGGPSLPVGRLPIAEAAGAVSLDDPAPPLWTRDPFHALGPKLARHSTMQAAPNHPCIEPPFDTNSEIR
ncbi:hypothetical protein [Jiella mangrovi]|uniref:Uncharacterized protein n=1 Tax=Jiella mangrovi TaxID=2821407 RepID=A0ABS4BMC2_9HYPH|nr:hypothetical protein [Jiella mangrovi]MBP0617878.1 hypothetical protein [Jiella mangrovi]